jgi:voltage-gated potassium channel
MLTVAFLAVAAILSFVIYIAECDNGPPYNTYVSTVQAVIPVLIISGMDVGRPPATLCGLLCSYLLMIGGILYIAVVTAMITTESILFRLRRGISMGKVKFERHILICGWVNRARDILDQLFAPDLKKHSPVVIVDQNIEESPMDHPLLMVIKGDPTETAVLEQVNAHKAKSAIILADREDGDPNAADARNLLIVLAIETLQPEIYSCVEVLNPDNKKHFERAGVDEVISVAEISNHLVVQAALNPGVSKLVSEMLTFGKGEEIYEKPVPPAFVGKSFADLATVLMRDRAMVLIGVRSDVGLVTSQRSRWQFKDGDMVFVLSEDEPEDLERLAAPA